ncbi:hypothetical protein [Planctomyces sp. SH-PL14]|uniref:hypothetical protein n=1 Tax=Planctomyces sp. SH-PL14 TaxID=1632864 RepID=UPI00078DD9D4|nr:hypothetical protein [Planctomyces sp. SH-PL14]AMV18849.1 hypothetical protein VT03_13245 [Planctomyces sp. SH-PL14]
MLRSVLIATAVLLPCLSLHADLPSLRFDQMSPLGVSAGGSVEVEVKGNHLEGVDRLVFDQPGITAEPVMGKERFFRITISDNVPVGTYDVYLSGRFGVSNPRLLAVTKGLAEVADNGKNRTPTEAQPIELNTAVNGTADGNADDFYRLVLRQGQRITVDCQAGRLGSQLDAVMSLTTPDGRALATSSDWFGPDPFLDVVVPADGEYLVALHDLSYRGGQPYRLVVSDRPRVDHVFPAAVQAGPPANLTAFGQNFSPLGGSPSSWNEGGGPLDQRPFAWTADPAVLENGNYLFRDHPSHHSTSPTAATCTLTGQQVVMDGIDALWSFPPVVVTPHPVVLDQEPNDAADAAQKVALPLVVAGRFDRPQDADWFEFQVPENGAYNINVYCERIAGRADPYLVLTDAKGNRLNELDDFGHRISGFDGHLRDPSQEVNLNKETTYRALVQDRYRRGGARYLYVLEIARAEADFYPAVIHRSNQDPAGTTVFKGTATYLDVVLHHRGNARSDVTITGEDLPPGLHVAPTTITSNTRGHVVLWADDNAPDWTGPIRLVATSTTDGKTIRRVVRPYSRVWNNSGTSLVHRSQMVAIREPGPFDLAIEPAEIEVKAGDKVELTLKLTRRWPEFRSKVAIQPLEWPGQFRLGNFDIASDATSAPLKVEVQQGTRPGRYTLTVLGQAQVPFDKDPNKMPKPETLVATPSRPVTFIVREK